MSDVIYPTLDLFLYDLRNALNSTELEIQQSQENFRKKLPNHVELVKVGLEADESNYLELIPNQQIEQFSNKVELNGEKKELKGYYYPVRLHDTYGLQIDCSVEEQIIPQPVNSFRLLKKEIEERLRGEEATIGKTWLLSACRPKNSQMSFQDIAVSCYESLVENGNFKADLKRQGKLFTGEIFECLHNKSINEKDKLHILIIIYPHINSLLSNNLYSDWMGLFCYKHKIMFAYSQSQSVTKTLTEYSQQFQDFQNRLNNNKKSNIEGQLKNIQNILNKYTILLPILKFQKQTLDINLINYKNRLNLINDKIDPRDDLNFLNELIYLSRETYLIQMTKDYENMELGLRLLESNINFIRSQIETEKAERESIFQTIVTVVGTGTAFTSLIDSSSKESKCKAIATVTFEPLKPNIDKLCEIKVIEIIIFPMAMILILGLVGLGFKSWLMRRKR